MTIPFKLSIPDLAIVHTEILSSDEGFAAIFCIEKNFVLREGYEIVTNITCSKGPQQTNWYLTFFFESEVGVKTAWQLLQDKYDGYHQAFMTGS